MTGEEMRAALVELGWKQADLCRRIDKDKNTVSKWAAHDPPAWVAEYLGAMLALDRLHRQFVRPLRAADLASEAGAAGEETPPRNSRAAQAAKRLRTDKRFQPAE